MAVHVIFTDHMFCSVTVFPVNMGEENECLFSVRIQFSCWDWGHLFFCAFQIPGLNTFS